MKFRTYISLEESVKIYCAIKKNLEKEKLVNAFDFKHYQMLTANL
jgi:hypothetical protein